MKKRIATAEEFRQCKNQKFNSCEESDLLVVKDLSIYYGCCGVIQNLSFSIKSGGIVSIVGNNGSGKSTFLKTLAGIHEHFCGKFSWNFSCGKNEVIGYLPQHAEVNRYLSIQVQDVVGMGVGAKKKKCAVDRALACLGLTNEASRYIGTLSGGQFQRMLFARLLAMDLDIFLLDEPFISMDETSQNILIEQLFVQSKNGKTFFLAHHQDSAISPYCKHILKLFPGTYCWSST
ncbi:metal ABC transporter ATP-binding protein [Holospora elegans]|uniref:metal ABC transporter ATP-binding protein n=1 Tax=Holospora elegans TaxID=431043 RepID=UPI00139F2C98|nr:ATP-binding cassette domain-containing protein [Holospora elegans]